MNIMPPLACNEPAVKYTMVMRQVCVGPLSTTQSTRSEYAHFCQRHSEILEAQGWQLVPIEPFAKDYNLRCRYGE